MLHLKAFLLGAITLAVVAALFIGLIFIFEALGPLSLVVLCGIGASSYFMGRAIIDIWEIYR